MYTVYRFFVMPMEEVPACLKDEPALQRTSLDVELRAVLERMETKLSATASAGVDLMPHVAPVVATQLADANGLCGAAKRVVACQSLRALVRCMQTLQVCVGCHFEFCFIFRLLYHYYYLNCYCLRLIC